MSSAKLSLGSLSRARALWRTPTWWWLWPTGTRRWSWKILAIFFERKKVKTLKWNSKRPQKIRLLLRPRIVFLSKKSLEYAPNHWDWYYYRNYKKFPDSSWTHDFQWRLFPSNPIILTICTVHQTLYNKLYNHIYNVYSIWIHYRFFPCIEFSLARHVKSHILACSINTYTRR